MSKFRVIARIDVKNEYVIKGIHLEGLRKVGNPNEMALRYYEQGIDEIIFMDAVAAYYDRNSLGDIIEKACKNIFVPITVGGGIRSIADIKLALSIGADKVAINTQAVKNPAFIEEASRVFGSQCIVSSIVAKKISKDKWEAYIDNGREPTGLDVLEWAKKVEHLGAGEIMLTSVDMEGTKKGFDLELYSSVCDSVSIPVIASGGAGSLSDIEKLLSVQKNINAVALASVLHYEIESIGVIKSGIGALGVGVRI
ncbi:MAG: imidazole glycerol phosphate synthase subunit HisF [Campylobacterales bacterium]